MSRRSASFRSRSTLVWSCAFFTAIQAAVLGVVLSIPAMREPIYGRKLVRLRSRLAKTSDRPLTIAALGSSRTLNGFRGDHIEPILARETGRSVVAFNMGIPGGGPVSNLLYLRRLLGDGIRPDIAIFENFPRFLNEASPQREITGEALHIDNLRREELGLVRRYASNPWSPSLSTWCLARSNPLYQNRFKLLTCSIPMLLIPDSRQNKYDSIDDSGWFGVPEEPSAATKERALNAVRDQYESSLKTMKPSLASLQPIHEALQLCRQRNITAVLVLMPEGPYFRSLYHPVAWARVRPLLEEAGRPWKVPVIDARDWFPDESAFIDSHHQYPEAAAKYSQRLARELLSLPAIARYRKASSTTGESE